ncbi:MAG: hypothetical protein IMF11_18150 [Proteobacteria bacterium]|nr:hypothetical protein [Pseudomonadota bacterium]
MTIDDFIQDAALSLSENITSTLRELLETKHLYQNQSIGMTCEAYTQKAFLSIVKAGVQSKTIEEKVSKLYKGSWHAWQPSEEWKGPAPPQAGHDTLIFRVPHVKLFCHRCDRVEPFNYILGQDVLETYEAPMGANLAKRQSTTQIFVLSFLCQSCKAIPEVFLVRREANKLTLSGRSPFEEVEVPHFIPKTVARFFSGAIVAHQSGETLAGLFLFRVLIEQWVQPRAKEKGLKTDQFLNEYMGSLDTEFKETMPSLTSEYEKLSDDIHNAIGSTELFEETRQQIIKHFDARRLFGLPIDWRKKD